jgi:hypothetical protein
MPESPSLANIATPRRLSRVLLLAETALVFCVFALDAGWPVPDVNEAHYLAKARHVWNPAWAPGDFFLESADAHTVFYWTCGWATLLMPLPAVAWCGRIVTWWLLAWSWRRLSASIVAIPWCSVITAGLFVALSEGCHMAGEWVVGGFEAKGFAYVLVFLSLEALVRDRWTAALTLLGGASAFHVLVGGWTVVAVVIAWLCLGRGRRPASTALLPGLAMGLVLALPGLIPALMLERGTSTDVLRQANEIYVFQRLRHHLVPSAFEADGVLRHLALIGVWILLCLLTPYSAGELRFRLVVLASLVIAFLGMIVAAATANDPALAAGLLRYYWFRLGDALLPMGVAIVGLAHARYALRVTPAVGQFWIGFAVAVGGCHLSGHAVDRLLPPVPRGDKPGKVLNYQDWREACAWVADNTPAAARFLTPRMQQTFKWHTGRAETVSWKDVPQDAAGLVEWWRRVNEIHWDGAFPGDPQGRWRGSLAEQSPAELRRIGAKYGAQFLLTEAEPPLSLPLLFRNETYAVYGLEGG